MTATNQTLRRLAWVDGPADLRPIDGAANGLTVPSVRVRLAAIGSGSSLGWQALLSLANALQVDDPAWRSAWQAADQDATSHSVRSGEMIRVWTQILGRALTQVSPVLAVQVAGQPRVIWQGRLFSVAGAAVAGWVVLWPTHWPQDMARLLAWSLAQWQALAQLADDENQAHMLHARSAWESRCQRLRRRLPTGFNPPQILSAAHALGYPVYCLDGEILQVGQGRRARWWRSTLTDSTPSLGVTLARDKVLANRWLAQAGISVPRHVEVKSAAEAVAAARQLGWPVVVKPADQDRGDGARANLQHDDLVASAFEHARRYSHRVLVEKHVEGCEYRLTVLNGELLWAHERVPATVMGDGSSTLQVLIDSVNAIRRVALQSDPDGWQLIQMDADNLNYLQENDKSLDDVPSAGEVVRLQRVPAATTGGEGRGYFDTIHPDNRLLAERAARMLRLDIAGVDLIMPDITRSWREVGGAVTEVNAVPQMSIQTDPTLAQRMVQKIMRHRGRIPVLHVMTEAGSPVWLDAVVARLESAGLRVGVSTSAGLYAGLDWIHGPRTSVWKDARLLLTDPSVGAIVMVCDGDCWLKTGLPFDGVDGLVVEAYRPQALALLLPYARGCKAVLGDEVRQRYGALIQPADSTWRTWSAGHEMPKGQLDELVSALLAAEAAYACGASVEA